MNHERRTFSVCIPAYNRAQYLPHLLDSIFSQNFKDFEILICEDCSPERRQIADIVSSYKSRFPDMIRYYENETNLGYDENIRNLIEYATGTFCFFMGNDDLMCPGALAHVDELIRRHPNVGVIIKSYTVFDTQTGLIVQELRYFTNEREISAGLQAVVICFRRSGVISGYIVHRDDALACGTNAFDGTLYYQMHLTANVLLNRTAVFTPKLLVMCRSGERPDFGNSANEKGRYTPGRYTPEARLNMVQGALTIAASLSDITQMDILASVKRDYANYFYPFIMDQLSIPIKDYYKLYRGYWKMGFGKFPIFHIYCIACYFLGAERFNRLASAVRRRLGRNVQIGDSFK
jgi:glycosyltransferase involved in cell wall biosynthesis